MHFTESSNDPAVHRAAKFSLTAATRLAWAAAALLAAACGGPHDGLARAAEPACSVRIIVGLERADPATVASLAAAAGVRLELVNEISPNLFLFGLAADGTDAECRSGIDRLQRDARVRSVEPDSRRRAHQP